MQPEEPDQYEFEDSDQSSNSDKLTIKGIVLKQLVKCTEAGSREMKGSGVMRRMVKDELIETPTPNNREIFLNSCDMLRILLLPELQKHKKVVDEHIKGFEEDVQKLFDTGSSEYAELEKSFKKYGSHDSYVQSFNEKSSKITEDFEREKVSLYQKKLLPAISFLLAEINYFDETSAVGGLE